ncbi:ATJ20 [Symbiodinium sp. CCMP2592]|nr:ATJ20 [Symbiodinium sp. CCMP2592]
MSPELLSLLQQAFRSPRRTASPSTRIMAEAAPPTGMGNRQLREWIQEWGSAWDFLGLAPGSAMSEVLRAYKRTAVRLHPDKSPPDEVEMATVRMQALGNAKEILLNPSLRILHDNILGVGVTGGTAPPPSSAAPDGGSGGTAPHHGWWNQAPPPKAPPTSSSSSAPPPSSKSAGKAPPPTGRGPGPSTSARGAAKGKSSAANVVTISTGENPLEAKGPLVMENLGDRSFWWLYLSRVGKLLLEMLYSQASVQGTAKGGFAEAVENLMVSTDMGAMDVEKYQSRPTNVWGADAGAQGPQRETSGNSQGSFSRWCGHGRSPTGDEQMEGEPQATPPSAAATSPQPPPPIPTPEPKSVYFAKKGLGKGKGMGAPPEGPLPHTPAAPKSYAANVGAPKVALWRLWLQMERALWFTVRDLDETTPRLVLPWTIFQHVVMSRRALCGLQSWGRVGVIFIRRVAQDILHWARRRGHMTRIQMANNGNPCFMDLQEAHPEPQGDLPPLSPATGDHRPLFTFQDFLRNPGLGQHYRNNEGPPRPGRTALPCIYSAPTRQLPLAESYAEADRAQNVMGRWATQILGDEPAVPPDEGAPPKGEGKGDSAPSSTSSGKGTGNTFKKVTHWYCKRCSYGVPITRTFCTMCSRPKDECVVSDEEEEEDDVALNEEELAEVARLERECAELEQRMRGLNAGQQRALLENLANSSSAVMGGLLADTIRRTAQLRGQKGKGGSSNVKVRASNETARNDPKYVKDLEEGVSMAVAFQRHRSRLRAVQHQVAQGNVALQPRMTPAQTVRTMPPMMSLGRAHRLYLLNRLERLERQGVTWTQEEVGNCYTMEQFLDYLEARVGAEAERAEPTTASKSAGAPPPTGVPPPSGPTASTSTGTSSAPSGTTADGRPEPPSHRSDPAQDQAAGRPVDPDQGHDQPEAHPSAPSATSEGGEAAGDTAPAESDLPADDSARRSAVDGFHL